MHSMFEQFYIEIYFHSYFEPQAQTRKWSTMWTYLSPWLGTFVEHHPHFVLELFPLQKSMEKEQPGHHLLSQHGLRTGKARARKPQDSLYSCN